MLILLAAGFLTLSAAAFLGTMVALDIGVEWWKVVLSILVCLGSFLAMNVCMAAQYKRDGMRWW